MRQANLAAKAQQTAGEEAPGPGPGRLNETAGRAGQTQRLFFALWPDDELAGALADVAVAAARRLGGRPTRRDTVHLTLAFLGDVAATETAALIAAAQRVRALPFQLNIDRLGYWRHNRLLWAGCAPCAALAELAGSLHRLLSEVGYSPAESERAFAPHLTLVRKLPSAILPPALAEFSSVAMPVWRCTRFVLVASRMSAAGPSYTTIAEFPLDG